MATNDDLDDFFKKKDRKSNKHKKQSGLLTNTQELLKQLEIVTSATSTFKEQLDLGLDDEDLPVYEDSAVAAVYPSEEPRKTTTVKTNKVKFSDQNNKHAHDQEIVLSRDTQQQDEWEDFESASDKYEQLRLKYAGAMNDEDEDFNNDDNNPLNNNDNSDLTGDRQRNKDKPAWRLDQIKREQEINVPTVEEKREEVQPVKPAPVVSAYRPPHARSSGGAQVPIVAVGSGQRPTKKKEPNLASIDDFPSLRATVIKK